GDDRPRPRAGRWPRARRPRRRFHPRLPFQPCQGPHAMTSEINPQAATPAAAPPAPANGKRRRALLVVAVVLVLAGVAWLAYYLLVARWHQDTDDAYVQGNVVSIVPQTVGTVVAIDADDGMKVEAGQPLVELDRNDAQVAY